MKALESHYSFKIFTKHELEDDFFDDVDMVAFPGGIGDSDSYEWLFKINGTAVKKFVNNGGRYLGICMGAYWAGKHYFNILKDVDAEQYIKRPDTDTRRPHPKNIDITWRDQPMNMYFYDGCAFVGDERKFETVARYANGDPMAIIQNRIGIIGCHPESEPHWYQLQTWMKGKYHNGDHHKLLLDFVNELMKR
jgi:glutamine amidotransferase-like uncharacterized protein